MKFTIETREINPLSSVPQVSKAGLQKALEIILETFSLLKKVGWEDAVEYLKATVWMERPSWRWDDLKRRAAPEFCLAAEFMVEFTPPLMSDPSSERKEDGKFKVTARWESYRREIAPCERGFSIRFLPLVNSKAEVVATGLIRVMQLDIGKRQPSLERRVEWLEEAQTTLRSLTKTAAKD